MAKLSGITAHALSLLVLLFTSSTLAAYNSLWSPSQSGEVVGYSRVIEIHHAGDANGKLLATFEHSHADNAPSHYIIRESTDDGTTWDTVTTVLASGDPPTTHYYQPFLFEFPQQLGKYAAGTILLVGNLVNASVSDFYSWRSTDHGKTWDQIGVWQQGWPDKHVNKSHGIWEPFLFLDNQSNLVAVFSDERRNEVHSQKLVRAISKDGGGSWDNATDIVVGSEQTFRPGMATVAKMGNGEYFMSYEWCDSRNYPATCQVHGKTSKDGITWDTSDEGVLVASPDGVGAYDSPYSIWDPVGKQLIVSSFSKRRPSNAPYFEKPPHLLEDRRTVHINLQNGTGNWHCASAPWYAPSSEHCTSNYSPNMLQLPNGTILYSARAPANIQGEPC
ncbi:Sialidase [Aspergillus pseudotamarii]|uniref:Sialidase n=1 Tax=Aspergillus pseudotamarii TaxID=132259 RepID=A0A5N6SKI5_ASPPS|nr:Sialidase [Aspergillus pseudotamarii]KAE8135085.1 Sialidase [Aspergillus pseudotamarii]